MWINVAVCQSMSNQSLMETCQHMVAKVVSDSQEVSENGNPFLKAFGGRSLRRSRLIRHSKCRLRARMVGAKCSHWGKNLYLIFYYEFFRFDSTRLIDCTAWVSSHRVTFKPGWIHFPSSTSYPNLCLSLFKKQGVLSVQSMYSKTVLSNCTLKLYSKKQKNN